MTETDRAEKVRVSAEEKDGAGLGGVCGAAETEGSVAAGAAGFGGTVAGGDVPQEVGLLRSYIRPEGNRRWNRFGSRRLRRLQFVSVASVFGTVSRSDFVIPSVPARAHECGLSDRPSGIDLPDGRSCAEDSPAKAESRDRTTRRARIRCRKRLPFRSEISVNLELGRTARFY